MTWSIASRSSIRPSSSKKAFDSGGRRKLMVATNVAETSITIPNIDAVIELIRAAKDPVNMVGFIAANVLRDDVEVRQAHELDAEGVLIDVRDPDEYAAGSFETAVNIPTDELEKKIA
mgnify:CR=1 FL=1